MFCIAVNLNIEYGDWGAHLGTKTKQIWLGSTSITLWKASIFNAWCTLVFNLALPICQEKVPDLFISCQQYKIKQGRWCPMLIILQVPLLSAPSSLYWCPHYLDCLLRRTLDKTFCSNGKISCGTFTLYECKKNSYPNCQHLMVPLFDFARQKRWSNDFDWW